MPTSRRADGGRRFELTVVLRGLLAALFLLVAGAQVARTALLTRGSAEGLGIRAWPSHPDVLADKVMAEVATSAARGETPSPATLSEVEQLARIAPLKPEPFLIKGAIAVRGGDYARAERLLLQGRLRAPRSAAARYLLADLYLRTGKPLAAMREMAILNRLLPEAASGLAPALAAYAQGRGTQPGQLRAILKAYPELEPRLLNELALDARNADLVLALARPAPPSATPIEWQQRLFSRLIEKGDFERARAIWEKMSGARVPRAGLFNPVFGSVPAPPPFNWEFPSTSGGVAEPRNGLHVLYYGRENLVLARQLTMLSPGAYRLTMTVTGDVSDAGAIRWTVTCLPGGNAILELPLSAPKSPAHIGGGFTVPAGCAAQRIELAARSQDMNERADVQISDLRLARAR